MPRGARMGKTSITELGFYKWLALVRDAASGVADPALLPNARRRKERELAELTTPANCLSMAAFISRWLPEDEYAKKQVKCAE